MASLPLLLLPVCLMLRQKLPRLIDEVKKLPRQMPLQHIQHPVDVLQQPVGKAPFFLQRLLQLHVLITDCAGLGWNHDFHPDDAVDSDYNKTFKTYVNQGNASDKKYTTKHIYEKELQTAEDQFDMNGFYGSDYYVKSGSGTICLSQTGKVNDVKLSFKYGHNQFGPAVSVSYPWGVSFGLDGAETIFQPDEIVYNDFATVK